MSLHDPERALVPHKVGQHAAWAMAVGGMIGGGIYTLAGVILGDAGPLAWLSLLLGGAIALATVKSYARLTLATKTDAVPVTVYAREGRSALAGLLAWLVLLVYILALSVYTFTVGHYLGRALGLDDRWIAGIEVAIVGALVLVNLKRIEHPAIVQIVAVWVELAILGSLAAVGFARWNPDHLVRGVPGPSLLGVLIAMAGTFIAFEGFEMLAYDTREMQRPRKVLRSELSRAVITVAIAYAVVTVGAASLVGADELVQHKENALAVAGHAAAGNPGLVVVTIAACASGISAINATLFSVSRLARTTAERGLLPRWCATCNRHDAPVWSIVAIGASSLVVAITSELGPLVAAASLGFLALFCLVNVLAFRRLCHGRWASGLGAAGAGASAVLVAFLLVQQHPTALVALAAGVLVCAVLHALVQRYS